MDYIVDYPTDFDLIITGMQDGDNITFPIRYHEKIRERMHTRAEEVGCEIKETVLNNRYIGPNPDAMLYSVIAKES